MKPLEEFRLVTRNQWLVFSGAMTAAVAWVFYRIAGINPAILGDEWVYLVTSRHVTFWEQDPPFNLGNHLFDLVYKSTLLFENYYLATKALNTLFFALFIFALFAVALRFLGFWWALAIAFVSYISPVSMYTSMYLPESIYFALIGWSFYFFVVAMELDRGKDWVISGSILGLAALAKPHALITAMAFGIFVIIYSLARPSFVKEFLRRALGLGGGFLLMRLGAGFVLAGPLGLQVFGSYGSASTVGTFVGSAISTDVNELPTIVGAGQVAGAIGLFPTQLQTHVYSTTAFLGAGLAVIVALVLSLIARKAFSKESQLALLVFVWLATALIAIVLFTGWITGAGDDHTLRVLLRYYDFLFPIVSLTAIIAVVKAIETAPAWARWVGAGIVLGLLTPAFSGYFGQLVIQIADAPNLAGLVVDRFTFEWTGGLIFVSLMTLAFFPRYAKYAVAASLSFTLALTGYQAQDQYQAFRGDDNRFDALGKYLGNKLSESEKAELLVIAPSNFDGRLVSFWLDVNAPMEVWLSLSSNDIDQINHKGLVLVLGDELGGYDGEVVEAGEGYLLIRK